MKYILFIILFAILVIAVFLVLTKFLSNDKNNQNNENDKNIDILVKEKYENFIVDESKIKYEKSCKFSDKELNDKRVAWGFEDTKYFQNNKDAIFKHYNCDKELIDFYNEKIKELDNKFNNDIKDVDLKEIESIDNSLLLNIKNYRVGFGKDDKNNIKKIYISDNEENIYSLKIGNRGETISNYDASSNFTKSEFMKFVGKEKGKLFYEQIIKLEQTSPSQNKLEILEQINSEYNPKFKNDGETYNGKHEVNIITYKRTDNNRLTAYIFSFLNSDIKLKNCRETILKILEIFDLNNKNFDSWLDKNKDCKLTWLSVNKNKNKYEITFYYSKDYKLI